MAENKKSVLIYIDWISTFEELEDDEAGRLIKHFFRYVNDLHPEAPDRLTKLMFEPIKQVLKRDLVKYEEIRNKNKENALLRWNKNNATASERIQTNANYADNDSDNVNDSDINKKTIYIYSEFYDRQLKMSDNDSKYLFFVKFIYGQNETKEKLSGLLSIPKQLSFENFNQLLEKSKVNGIKLMDVVLKIENDKKYWKGKKSLYLTMNNWIENRFIK